MSYPIIQLHDDAPTQLEQLGTKTKFWYRDDMERSILFKEGRPGTGENWAEKVSCEICKLLGIPHADYDLAIWKKRKGVATPNFVPEGGRLVLGNELLAKVIDGYDGGQRYQVRFLSATSLSFPSASRFPPVPIAISNRPLGINFSFSASFSINIFFGSFA